MEVCQGQRENGMKQNAYGNSLITLASVVAMKISQDLDTDTINILGAFFNILGDQLNLLAIIQQNEKGQNSTDDKQKNKSASK